MNLLTATDVQTMLGVEDGEILAHGYTFDRETVDIYFQDGQLIRTTESRGGDWHYEKSPNFRPEFFHGGIKRWYEGTAERGLNAKLLTLFETFGAPLSTTPGGRY